MLLAAAVAAWLNHLLVLPPGGRGDEALHRPDAVMTDFDMAVMDAQGHLRSRLRGTEMRHYADDNSTEVLAPRLTVVRDDQPAWHLSAERGWASAGGELVQFVGPVAAESEGPVGTAADGALRIETSDLRVRVDESFADTDRAVTIHNDRASLSGVGMRAWLRERRLQLLDKVRTRYEP